MALANTICDPHTYIYINIYTYTFIHREREMERYEERDLSREGLFPRGLDPRPSLETLVVGFSKRERLLRGAIKTPSSREP